MAVAKGTEALVALEDSCIDALWATVPNSARPIWPYMRNPLAQAARDTEFSHRGLGPKMGRKAAFAYLRDAMRHRGGRLSAHRDVPNMFYTSGITVGGTPEGQHNWLVDPFAHALGDDAIVLQKAPFRYSSDTDFPHTYSFSRALAMAEIRARLRPLRGKDATHVREVVRTIYEGFEFEIAEDQVDEVERLVLFQLARARGIEASFSRVLDRINPQTVIMDLAAYGNMAGQIGILKDRGILVVEPQHGWIGSSHPSYNFGKAMKKPALQRVFPDVLLTYGDYWSSQIRFPAEVVSVGKPYLEQMASKAPPHDERNKEVLVASSVTDFEEMSDFTLSLRDALPEPWTVSFRPHPSERAEIKSRYPRLIGAPRVSIDHRSDVYESLSEVRGVVSVLSTVLFEAVAFNCLTFVKDSQFSDLFDHPAIGPTLSGPESLKGLAQALEESVLPEPRKVEEVWKSGAVATFIHLLDERGKAKRR